MISVSKFVYENLNLSRTTYWWRLRGFEGLLAKPAAIPAAAHGRTSAKIPSKDSPKVKGATVMRAATAAEQSPYVSTSNDLLTHSTLLKIPPHDLIALAEDPLGHKGRYRQC